jgi:hypothetical protein
VAILLDNGKEMLSLLLESGLKVDDLNKVDTIHINLCFLSSIVTSHLFFTVWPYSFIFSCLQGTCDGVSDFNQGWCISRPFEVTGSKSPVKLIINQFISLI